ncbi:jg20847 [Pararge aegeria aegeria]|uniref:N-terminal acetyltransferase B complex subunit MDM20 homolog n=1 Tax=Pararge aegeria aegeria TaxID=348720 RepID=A0A8S4R172_9NEOP|nr:jg20847 [Pararge aegeria aegeria]
MPVRPQHTHNGGIVERRLRPIYDWLDNGNNKKALQEAEKVLKKSPSLQAARALKALAMFRLGKGLEAHAVLQALADEKPSDDTTLQAMTILYRESQQFMKVCELYEAAVKAEPTSEELHSHLFMSYVRVGDYRAQQRSAMALYKIAPKNPYYFWVVMSVVLQAKTAEDSTKKGILLSLAQRMVDNFISDNKMEAEQEARLYIMILELQEKWEDILNFIEGPLYPQFVPGSTAQACIPYLKKLGQWQRLNLLCKDLLWDNQDRWDYYLPYFDSVFQLLKNDCDADNTADDSAEKCHEFICQLVESMSSGRTLRGPYLARLELWKRLSVDGDPTELLGSGVALCIQYLRVFASKSCAVPDLKTYLAMIPQKVREDSCRDFLTCLGYDENSEPESIDDIQRHISCLCAWRLTSPLGTAEEYLAVATTLRKQYLRCASRGLVTATQTEYCAADGYGTLAAHHYFYAAIQQQNAAPIVEALCLLELVLHNSPSNVHVKLLMITLYHVLVFLISIKKSLYSDNRDLNAIISWEPPQCADPDLKARTFDQDVAYLRLKDGLVSSIALCIECSDSRSVEEKRAQLEELQACIEAFSCAMEKCREKYSSAPTRLCISAPFPSRIIAFVSSPVPYRDLYSSVLTMVCELCSGDGVRGRESAEKLRGLLMSSRQQLDKVPSTNAWGLRESLETFSNYLEFIGVITFLLGVCNELTAPTNTKKSKKKTNQSPDQILTMELLSKLNDDVQDTISFLEDIFEKWPTYNYALNIEDELAKLEISSKYQCPVEQKLKNGLHEMLADVKNILKKKSKYLKTLQ